MSSQEEIRKAEYLFELGAHLDAWHILEDLPSEVKTTRPVLILQLRILVAVQSWEKAEILGESLDVPFPDSSQVWYALAQARCMRGKVEEAEGALKRAFALDEALRLASLSDPALAAIWNW